ncbi:Peroxidase 60-like protein [Drosera capensis]
MVRASGSLTRTLALVLLLITLTGQSHGALQHLFYSGKCGRVNVELVIFNVIKKQFLKDRTLVAALTRLQFHDCFVDGCDASILIDGPDSEKTAGANGSVRGFEVIDAAKAAVEELCPGVVSCADIIIIAARAAVFLAKGTWYEVQTGRRDGLVSLASNVNLPGPTIPVPDAVALFESNGLSVPDLVLLLGGHTVGITHCFFITDRLYDFQGTGQPDPTMSPALLASLRNQCPENSLGLNPITLDQNMSRVDIVDNSFFKQLMERRGVLQIDQELAFDPSTRGIVRFLANASDFPARFGFSMVKLGAVGVLTKNQGQIRRNCRVVNK